MENAASSHMNALITVALNQPLLSQKPTTFAANQPFHLIPKPTVKTCLMKQYAVMIECVVVTFAFQEMAGVSQR